MTNREPKKDEEDFFLGFFTGRGKRSAGFGGTSDEPSRLRGLAGPSKKWIDIGDPLKEEVGGEVAQVEMLVADDSLRMVVTEPSLTEVLDGQLR